MQQAAAPVLRAERVHKRFGGVHALRGADLVVLPGEIHALVGENGSGKSTLLKIVGGQLQPDAGALHVTEGSGIATVSQETTLVPDLSIAENILLGHQVRRRGVIDWRATRALAASHLRRLGLELDVSQPVRRLRPDQAQMVEIARALSADARILILDEPTSSLTDDEVESLFASVRRVRSEGVATIFVSHRLNEVFALCDRVTTLRDGRTVGSGPVSGTTQDDLVELMVGRLLDTPPAAAPHVPGAQPVLRARDLSSAGAFEGVDLDVGPGEIVGLAGLVGAGRTELLESLFGLHRLGGRLELAGSPVVNRSPADAIRNGIALVPADRKRHGLVLGRSVRDNLLMAAQSRIRRLRVPRAARELAVVRAVIERLRIRTHSPSSPVMTLSGGNQQKVLLAKWLQTNPRLLMLDEPTRGVDVGAKGEIYRLLLEARTHGIGILVSSSEAPELLMLCDRIVVMFRGRVCASLSRAEANEAEIARLAGGHA